VFWKDSKMDKKLMILPLVALSAACANHTAMDEPARGASAVNVPVIEYTNYAFDVAAPGGNIPASEEGRLDAWFATLDLGYGDSVYVDSAAYGARDDVARIAGRYGLLLSQGAPVTQGSVPSNSVRVVVSRARASVPNCPNWSEDSTPTWNNRQSPNYGCAVNSNLAAMVANPEDLIRGRSGASTVDNRTSTRAVQSYRDATPTGQDGLQDISTGGASGGKGGNSGGGK
jgi:pilus assembly protein CpaD